ncbi:MAG: ABC transporter ATP-binding protein [Actinomyces sp.]|jgi:ABC-2 type transport system ATP-binding protein|nr:ABC transporter ATP-binding protein [Actinomyces sp.]MCI1642138.1 ABC transporter ATP-binding protein [Actinomyces sp.]MCI1662408.1 ABC transporter ATP-binding protein [Actinomyces sp.]MCI1691236.1 ABC transporter ATP-binding protein [Actinomyces sp.]MCI1830469.1 ABC transporter ATP-binding protein [Actinomyces sp.]MCI1866024.1 ABC transporter ATP-binding protein [Actinomyces sp.]
MMDTGIEVTGLTKDYGRFRALDHVDLALPAGHVTGLMGENGSGKTTLLKILAGVLSGWDGDVRICGRRPGPESKAVVSYLPDASFLPDGARSRDAIALYARFFEDFDARRAREMIDFFELPAGRTLKELSKGMREKLQIALAMSRRARVYLLDEPISGVDPAARDIILRAVLEHFDPDALMVLSTHLIADVEPLIDTVVFLRHGKVLLHEDADDLRAQTGLTIDALFRKEYASC